MVNPMYNKHSSEIKNVTRIVETKKDTFYKRSNINKGLKDQFYPIILENFRLHASRSNTC